MMFQIISGRTLSRYLEEGNVLLIDLRSKTRYEQDHIPGALWVDQETAESEICDLWNGYIQHFGQAPDQIILYCDSGATSLILARELAAQDYPVLSLNGGYRSWSLSTT